MTVEENKGPCYYHSMKIRCLRGWFSHLKYLQTLVPAEPPMRRQETENGHSETHFGLRSTKCKKGIDYR